MCSGVLIGGLRDGLEVEAVVKVVQSWAAEQRGRTCEQEDHRERHGDKECWLLDIQRNQLRKSVNIEGSQVRQSAPKVSEHGREPGS